MRERLTGRPAFAAAIYEGAVGLLGWALLLRATLARPERFDLTAALLLLLLAIALKHEGFRVARPVTHSLAGVAILSALIALGPLGGAWVGALSGLLFLATRPPGLARWRLACFGSGLSALAALAGAAAYAALGGRTAPATLAWRDLPPLAALALTWFLADHLGWSGHVALAGGGPHVGSFLRAIYRQSLVVELLPLPLGAVVAVAHAAGLPAFLLLAALLVAGGAILQRANQTLDRAHAQVAGLSPVAAFSRALLASRLDVLELCRLLHEHIAQVVDAGTSWLGLYDARSGEAQAVLATGGAVLPEGLMSWLQEQRSPLLVRDAEAESLPFAASLRSAGFRSALFVPLQTADALIGLLAVESAAPGAYSEDDLRTAVTFTNLTAMAIQNARLLEAEQRRARQLATVGEVSRRVVAIVGMDRLFSGVVSLIRDAFGYYDVQIFTIDPATGEVVFRASTNPVLQQRGIKVARGQGLIGWVAESGQQAVVDDVATDPRYRQLEGLEKTRSEAVVPLKIEERLVGILDVQSDRPNAFGEDDLFVLRTLADQVAIAIEDNRLHRAEKARRQLADTLREMANALSSTLELQAVLDLVLSQLQRVIHCDAAAILEWEDGHFCIVAGRGESYAATDRCLTPTEDAELRRLVDNPAPRAFQGPGPGSPSSLAVPLLVKDRLIGALILERRGEAHGYSDEETAVVSTFANQAAVAIENARLYEAEQRRARELATIAEVGQRVASILDLDELFVQIVELVRKEFGYYHVSIFTVDEGRGVPTFRASTSPLIQQRGLSIRAGEGIISWVASHGEALLANDVANEPRYQHDEALPDTRAELAVPLRVEGRTVGVLDIQSDRPGAFTPEDLFITQTLADQVAVAVENARLYAALQEEAWVSTALLQVSELVARTRDLDEILASLVRLTPMLAGVDRCCLFLWDREAACYVATRAYGLHEALRESFASLRFAPGEFPLLDQVRATGTLALVDDAIESDLVPAGLARTFGMASALALPLRSQDEVLGVMLVDHVGQAHRFTQQRIALLAGIANQAALAIENVRLYRESLENERTAQELRLARQIQATFLPEACPQPAGWSIAATSRPARQVGGDLYDFIPLGAHRLGLVVADVSDKGVPAALFMALSRTVMRAVAAEGRSPAATLSRVNDLLLADSRSGMFVTMFYGILDTRTGELVYGSAGHNPAYWSRCESGELVRLDSRGIALGVVEHPIIEEGRIVMQPGDSLVLYTDGVTESLAADEREFGEEGLRQVIRAAGPCPAQALAEAINRAVQEFVGNSPQHDDYTLLVVARDRPENG